MANPRGFLDFHRVPMPERPAQERVRDYAEIFGTLPEEELRHQASRCMDCGVPFCNNACPLGNLIPDWNDLARVGDWKAAIDQLHATNNFPEFTGLICPAPCESACVLDIDDDPVMIKQIEYWTINHAFEQGWVVPEPPATRTGRHVAVVGSGPAGMAAAAELKSPSTSATRRRAGCSASASPTRSSRSGSSTAGSPSSSRRGSSSAATSTSVATSASSGSAPTTTR